MSEQVKIKSGILNQIIIEHPCTKDWEAMTPVEQGKYCAHCDKKVIESVSITKKEFLRINKQAKKTCETMCVRVHQDKKGRAIFRSRLSSLPVLGILLSSILGTAHAQGLTATYGDVRVNQPITDFIVYIEGSFCFYVIIGLSAASCYCTTIAMFLKTRYYRRKQLIIALLLGVIAVLLLSLRVFTATFFNDTIISQ